MAVADTSARPNLRANLSALRSPGVAMAAGLTIVFSLVFIVRTAFGWQGQTYFSLFDASMVSMTYARNLADGHGPVWNAGGEHVEGYTNLLWTLWMAVIHLVGVPDRLTSLAVMVSG